MSLLQRISRKPKIRFSREEALASRPIRNGVVQWDRNDNGEIQIWIPRHETRFGKVLERIFPIPEYREMVLDEIGSLVWELCDGNTTVEGLVKALRERYKLNRRETEASVTQYLKTLAERGLIGFQIEGGKP